jgi:hypothetical protein
MHNQGKRMARKTLVFFQIYYKEEQKEFLYPFSVPYKNETLSPYFENAIIAKVIPYTVDVDYIGVASWRLRQKRNDGSTQIILKRQGTFELTHDSITLSDFDVAILTPRSPTHKPLAMAVNWHGKAWVDAFAVLKRFLHDNKLCKVPNKLTNTIYENHFITKREIYCDYVSQCLKPVLEFISKEEIFNVDSGYLAKKRNDPEAIADYQRVSGRTDWSIAPFILERLFSIWIEYKRFNVINL